MWRPPVEMTVSEWADERRKLSPEDSAEHGKWRTARAEYLREVMDAFTDPRVETVVFMAGAQVGKTQVLLNCMGYTIDEDSCPFMVVMPTVDTAREWSVERLTPMLRDTECLAEKVAEEKSRSASNKQLVKTFPGGYMSIVGANSPSGLASKPMRKLYMDEINRFPASAGEEGDPVNLAMVRTENFWNRKIFAASTPTFKHSGRIEKLYENSDQRKWFVPCPHCDQGQLILWDSIRFPRGGSIAERADAARYHCVECDEPWTDGQRWRAVSLGEWRAHAPFSKTAGFWINRFYSPWTTIRHTVKSFLEAKDDPLQLRTWVNTTKAESWEDQAEAPKWETLFRRLEEYPANQAPAGVMFMTAGVDVQADRLEASVWGWGVGKESWLINHHVFDGDTMRGETWRQLTAILSETWTTGDGRVLSMSRMAVDSGYRSTEVYAWAFGKPPGQVMVIKGNDDSTAILGQPRSVDFNRVGKRINRGVKVWPIGVSALKVETYGFFELEAPIFSHGKADRPYPPGWIHLSGHICDEEACKQFTAEKLVLTTRKGYEKREWVQDRRRNEMLDCRNYARAAAESLGLGRRLAERLAAQIAALPVPDDMPPGRTTRPSGRTVAERGRRVR